MALTTIHQRRLEAAARSVAEKFQAFDEGLTPDERAAFGLALQQTGFGMDQVGGETVGYVNVAASGAWTALTQILLSTDWALGRRFPTESR